MADIYGNYSRRGLIKMNGEYDAASDEALSKYISGKDYEGVRTVEKMIDSADKIGESLKDTVGDTADIVTAKIMSSMDHFVDDIASSIKEAHELIVESGE